MTEFKLLATLFVVYICACALGAACVILYNRLPAKWFCDYDETPTQEHLSDRVPYKFGKPAAIVLSGFLACFFYAVYGLSAEFFIGYLFCFILEFIALSDIKFSIIPDQFVIAAAVPALAFAVTGMCRDFSLRTGIAPVLGAVCAVLIMVLINLLGKLVYKQDVMGMGDVKLFAAVGLAVGFPNVLRVFFIMLITAAIGFLFLAIAKRLKQGEYRPLGPYICLAAAAQLCFDTYFDKLAAWYLALLK